MTWLEAAERSGAEDGLDQPTSRQRCE